MSGADPGMPVSPIEGPLGLISGGGGLPEALARAARRRGIEVLAAAFPGLTDPSLEQHVDRISWHALGAVSDLLEHWRLAGVRHAVMAGKVPKTLLVRDQASLGLDAVARQLLSGLDDRRDDSILRAVAAALDAAGISLREQAELVPELLAGEGRLGRVEASVEQRADIAFGWPIAKAISALDVGQSVIVSGGAVLAVEAIEGTDAAIRRAAELGGKGACLVKVAKLRQDPRFDLPAVGPATIESLARAGAGVLAVEARRTLLLDRPQLIRSADERGIALVGVPPEGPERPVAGEERS